MTILEALEQAAAQVPAIKTVEYADLNEANGTIIDQLSAAEFPVLLIIPFAPVDAPGKSGVLKTTFRLNAFMLNRVPDVTVDYRASEIETQVIAPMRLLARQFVHKLNHHSIIDPETNGIGPRTYNPVYSSLDASLFGVEIDSQNVPVMESPNACSPTP